MIGGHSPQLSHFPGSIRDDQSNGSDELLCKNLSIRSANEASAHMALESRSAFGFVRPFPDAKVPPNQRGNDMRILIAAVGV
jgi:hypothetical protein